MAPSEVHASKSKKPRISARNPVFATIIVGTVKAEFTVHEELLTYHSPFFRAALNGKFKEAEEKKVVLEDVITNVFEFFVHWLYHGRLPSVDDNESLFKMWSTNTTSNLLWIFVFCDRYDVPKLKTEAMNTLLARSQDPACGNCFHSRTAVGYAYDNLPKTSGLRRFLVDLFCRHASPQVWTHPVCDNRIEFFVDALQNFSKHRNQPEEWSRQLNVCDYHEHRNDEERSACTMKM
ncbi:hypothetical protein NX059_009100 [Plenodomus lindquistii]|nr:hypothetical protein NX059_009100 [Plenodomus lindquistii]